MNIFPTFGRLRRKVPLLLGLVALLSPMLSAAGVLTPRNSQHQALKITDHHVDVVINNGFAQTTFTQTYQNPNTTDLEAIYTLPLPQSASLSEMSFTLGEKTIHGEVLPKEKARELYKKEKEKGNQSGLAEKDAYQQFRFHVSPVPAGGHASIRVVYYQPVSIDTGIGRFVYPLEEGGTDEAAESFWLKNDVVEYSFSASVTIRSSWPIQDVRFPGYENQASETLSEDGNHTWTITGQKTRLNKDLVVYYRLQENLPARMEMLTYKKDKSSQGTFMMVLTPGFDLQPVTRGSQYTFILDVSGSMDSKLHTLARGVEKALGTLKPQDSFRLIAFNNKAWELTRGSLQATPENVASGIESVKNLKSQGGTNLYAGIHLALKDVDDDKVNSMILVTDGVTNQGIIEPKAFVKLLEKVDIRLFGFLMGNNANWPLMRTICNTTGGSYEGISNSDDIIGKIMLAKSKITHESIHHAELKIRGIKTSNLAHRSFKKVYRGQQLVIFGHYHDSGEAKVTLNTTMSGEDKSYSTRISFPEVDTRYPEIERLWATQKIEAIEDQMNAGFLVKEEGSSAIEDLGLSYQLVTDETSMVVLSDQAFNEYGIERKNQRRVQIEQQAQQTRRTQPVVNHRVDKQQPMFGNRSTPSLGGGGSINPFTALIIFLIGSMALLNLPKLKPNKS